MSYHKVSKFTMTVQYCIQRLKGVSQLVQVYGNLVCAFCVLNLVFAVVATFGNLLVIRALRKASSIPTNLRKLLLNLAFSDLAVGLFPQPMFAVIVAMMLRMAANSNYNFDFLCPVILNVGYFTFFLLGCASFLTIAVITVDRILAIFLHLRYHELVTSERVVISLVCLWLTSAIAASILLSVPTLNQIVTAIILFTGLSLTTIAYILIYKVVKYHRNQIHHQHQITNAQDLNYLREKKSTFNALFVYIVFTACYFPHLCSVILLIANSSQLSVLVVEHISLFLLLLNSSLNPLVCYWRYGELRAIINGTLMKIFHI